VDRHGIPIGWSIDGANRNDVRMLEPTIDDIAAVGLLVDTLHLDRGYDSGAVRARLAGHGLTDVNIQLDGAARNQRLSEAHVGAQPRVRRRVSSLRLAVGERPVEQRCGCLVAGVVGW
jgi:Transposase DDE domain